MICSKSLLAGIWLLQTVHGIGLKHKPGTTDSVAHAQFTVPVAADEGQTLIANIDDPEAINAQSACPGYKASDIKQTSHSLVATLTLAGDACNVYGNDVDSLDISIDYLKEDLLKVSITPTYIDSSNASWFLLPDDLVPQTKSDKSTNDTQNEQISWQDEIIIEWTNEPTFQFRLRRVSNHDVIFDTFDTVLVFEDQFIEFVTALPPHYNLYGIGEHVQQSRLLENLTLTLWATDISDPIDSLVQIFLLP